MNPRQWYRIQNAADPAISEIFIYGDIGKSWYDDEAVSAAQFINELKALPEAVKTVRVRVNSLGGNVFEGIAIANALRDQRLTKGRTVETIVDGIAASIASVVVQAGSRIAMADNALMFLHEPWGFAIGNAKALRKVADDYDTVRGSIVATYRWNSKLSADEIVALLEAETWLEPDDAIEKGFATEKVEGLQVAARLDRTGTAAKLAVPEKYQSRVDALLKPADTPAPAPQPAAAEQILTLCTESGASMAFASSLLAAKLPLEQVQARIAADKTQRAAAQARADEIRGLCATAKVPELADGYIAGGMAVADVRAHLTAITARLDTVEIDTSLNPGTHTGAKDGDIAASWKKAFASAQGRRVAR